MECAKCKKELKNSDIGGIVDIPGMRKLWCSDCWE